MADKGGKSKLDEAAGGMDLDAEEDRKRLEMFHTMKRKPGIKTAKDFTHLIMQMEQMRVKEETEDVDVQRSRDDVRDHEHVPSHHYPKMSTFGGESGRGEVNWECFKFEIEALMTDGLFSREQILHGIRKSAKGEMLRRLGTRVTVKDVLTKLDSTYGNIWLFC